MYVYKKPEWFLFTTNENINLAILVDVLNVRFFKIFGETSKRQFYGIFEQTFC